MEKENEMFLAKKRNEEEVLEVSSTGYGLESVTKEREEHSTDLKTDNENPSCGGL